MALEVVSPWKSFFGPSGLPPSSERSRIAVRACVASVIQIRIVCVVFDITHVLFVFDGWGGGAGALNGSCAWVLKLSWFCDFSKRSVSLNDILPMSDPKCIVSQ